MSYLFWGESCAPAGIPLLGGLLGCTPEPTHDACPGHIGGPDTIGGASCPCDCHAPAAAVPEAQDGRLVIDLSDETVDRLRTILGGQSEDRLRAIVDNPDLTDDDYDQTCRDDMRDALRRVAAASAAVREGERERLAAIEAALRELVAVKDIKERREHVFDKRRDEVQRQLAYDLIDEYEARQPKAWAAARAALVAPSLAAPEGTEQ